MFSMIRSSILGKAAPTQPIAVKCIGCSNWNICFTVSTCGGGASVIVEIPYKKKVSQSGVVSHVRADHERKSGSRGTRSDQGVCPTERRWKGQSTWSERGVCPTERRWKGQEISPGSVRI